MQVLFHKKEQNKIARRKSEKKVKVLVRKVPEVIFLNLEFQISKSFVAAV